jgi:hypothetical protein
VALETVPRQLRGYEFLIVVGDRFKPPAKLPLDLLAEDVMGMSLHPAHDEVLVTPHPRQIWTNIVYAVEKARGCCYRHNSILPQYR